MFMAARKTYRHRVTGLVSELDPITARGLASQLEEVRPDAKPKVAIADLQPTQATKATSKSKEKLDV